MKKVEPTQRYMPVHERIILWEEKGDPKSLRLVEAAKAFGSVQKFESAGFKIHSIKDYTLKGRYRGRDTSLTLNNEDALSYTIMDPYEEIDVQMTEGEYSVPPSYRRARELAADLEFVTQSS